MNPYWTNKKKNTKTSTKQTTTKKNTYQREKKTKLNELFVFGLLPASIFFLIRYYSISWKMLDWGLALTKSILYRFTLGLWLFLISFKATFSGGCFGWPVLNVFGFDWDRRGHPSYLSPYLTPFSQLAFSRQRTDRPPIYRQLLHPLVPPHLLAALWSGKVDLFASRTLLYGFWQEIGRLSLIKILPREPASLITSCWCSWKNINWPAFAWLYARHTCNLKAAHATRRSSLPRRLKFTWPGSDSGNFRPIWEALSSWVVLGMLPSTLRSWTVSSTGDMTSAEMNAT